MVAVIAALAVPVAPAARAAPESPAASAPAAAALFDDAGYRIARYRSPVRSDPAPAAALPLAAALALVPGEDALFIDVMPAEGGVRDPVSGAWRLSTRHLTIPGALWHPEAGRAPVDAALWQALVGAVRAARRTAPDRPVVLFCRTDCWMSWNAARRLAAAGIGNVHWLAEGTDGWHAAGKPLVTARPVAVPAQPQPEEEN